MDMVIKKKLLYVIVIISQLVTAYYLLIASGLNLWLKANIQNKKALIALTTLVSENQNSYKALIALRNKQASQNQQNAKRKMFDAMLFAIQDSGLAIY